MAQADPPGEGAQPVLKSRRLKTRPEFLRAATGKKVHAALFSVQTVQRPDDHEAGPQVGFTVTKRVGNAPERNRIKRRLREAVRQLPPACMDPSHDYVIVARRDMLAAPFLDIVGGLKTAAERLKTGSRKGRSGSGQLGPDGRQSLLKA